MNFKLVFRITGRTLLVEACCMLLPILVCFIYGESTRPFVLTIAILLAVGGILSALPASNHFFPREGFFAVGLIWLLISAFGALPFWFSGYFPTYVDCLFEAASGFTTTGASILPAVENLPKGILFWRSFIHFLGGMGVLILTIALMPSLGSRTLHLMKAESPGPVVSKLVPKTSQSSKILYGIYCAMTAIQILCLRLTGMEWFDCIVNAFAVAGTGGFSVRNTSIGAYGNPAAEIVLTVFMLLFSINFAFYFLVLCGKIRQALRSDEFRFFMGVVIVSIVLITCNLWFTGGYFTSLGDTIRAAAFQVSTIISTTGFSSVDFDLIVILMFIGACAGSTGGALKCSRVLVVFKCIRREINQVIHPRSVNVVKLDGKVLPEDTLRSILIFFAAYILVVLTAGLVVALDNFSFGTTFTAVVSCIGNVGPGLELVGPMGNYSAFSALSKLVLTLCMIVGRLELLPILVLFSKSAWSRS